MLASRSISRTFLGAAVVAAALLPGTVRAGDDPAAVDGGVAADRTRAMVESHFDDLTPAERRERARQTGHVRVTTAARLSGRIIAESFAVEPGTVICTDGDIRIDGPIVPPPAPAPEPLVGGPRKAGAGGLVGADGGNCCNKSGGHGAPGGAGGAAGPSGAVPGKGGLGFTPGDDGTATANVGTKGAKGVKGEDCPGIYDEFISVTGTLPGPLFGGKSTLLTLNFFNTGSASRHLKIEVCCDGKVFSTLFVDVPAGTAAVPGFLLSLNNLRIDSPHAARRISIMANGKLVLLLVVAVI